MLQNFVWKDLTEKKILYERLYAFQRSFAGLFTKILYDITFIIYLWFFFRKLRQFVSWFVWFTPLFLLPYITSSSKMYFLSKWSNLRILRFSLRTGKCINSQLSKQNLNHLIILKPSVSSIGLKKEGDPKFVRQSRPWNSSMSAWQKRLSARVSKRATRTNTRSLSGG